MNMKVVSMCLICAGALLTGCGNGGKKEAETSERKEKEAVVGSDKDEHGCIASAGYTWSEVQKDCIRLWEKGVRMNAVDDAGKTLFLVFSPDSTRRGLPAGGYVWNVEDDDTKNVRLEDGEWTVSQRGRLIYQEDANGK